MEPRCWVAAAALALASQGHCQSTQDTDTIEVVGTTPLGSGIDAARLAANVQTANAEEIRAQAALDLADFMRRSFGSVFANDAQGNPLQPDIQYRGFVGSPLLGLPQGLAVYQDGVRLNEPFGDTVNWALIPESAVDSIELVPGSNPLFGLNALGGAISIRTKNGFSSPGASAELTVGSFGRVGLEAELGGSMSDRLGYFVTASYLDENGWRDFSPTRAARVFAAADFNGDDSRLHLTFTHADTNLVGNGAAPVDLLAVDRRAVFTRPDRTRNRMSLLTVRGEQSLSDRVSMTGNLYVRDSVTSTLNGDNSDFTACGDGSGLICDDAGNAPLDENGSPIPAAAPFLGATVNRTTTNQSSLGFTLQAAWSVRGADRGNDFVIGIARDDSGSDFGARTELGSLDATRLAVSSGVLVGDSLIDLWARTDNSSLYVSDTLSIGRAALTVSARYNRAGVVLEDRLGTDLNGAHHFERLNPAAGLTVDLAGHTTFYAGYSEANRAPSPVELTCADASAPCRLPNAFVADPPLKQVVARTLETGFRGRFGPGRWHAGWFRTVDDDDILFVSAGRLTNEGFFANVGKTRRQGIELNLTGGEGARLGWFTNYSVIDATFRKSFTVSSPSSPAAIGGEIPVRVGDRLPLVPDRLLKGGVSATVGADWTLRAELLASSGAYLRGDEGNLSSKIAGYAVVSFRAERRLGTKAHIFVSIDNLLDERYDTFGVFGDAASVLGPSYGNPRFLGPGAPRAAWIGIRASF
jgi:iron complex outermembrane recepter protein